MIALQKTSRSEDGQRVKGKGKVEKDKGKGKGECILHRGSRRRIASTAMLLLVVQRHDEKIGFYDT